MPSVPWTGRKWPVQWRLPGNCWKYYTIIRELPSGKGFADICLIPRKMHPDKPAVVIELKWNREAKGAIAQIKDRNYVDALKDYKGNLLLAGISYDRKTKMHTCVIEKVQKFKD